MEASTSSEVTFQIPSNSLIPHDSVPSEAEVESTITGFRSYLESEAGSEVGSFPFISSLDGSRNLYSVQQAFNLMDTIKPIQVMVKAAITNKAMWEAFLNVDEVAKFLQPLKTGANKFVAISSSKTHENLCRHQPSSGKSRGKVAAVTGRVTTIGSGSGPGRGLGQPEPSVWEKILLELIRAGQRIFKILFGGDNIADELKGKHPVASKDYPYEDEEKKEYAKIAYILVPVLMLCIKLLRHYYGIHLL